MLPKLSSKRPMATRTAVQSLSGETSTTSMSRLTRPGPAQLAWSISMCRLLITLVTTATWPKRIRRVERKLRMLPTSGLAPRS